MLRSRTPTFVASIVASIFSIAAVADDDARLIEVFAREISDNETLVLVEYTTRVPFDLAAFGHEGALMRTTAIGEEIPDSEERLVRQYRMSVRSDRTNTIPEGADDGKTELQQTESTIWNARTVTSVAMEDPASNFNRIDIVELAHADGVVSFVYELRGWIYCVVVRQSSETGEWSEVCRNRLDRASTLFPRSEGTHKVSIKFDTPESMNLEFHFSEKRIAMWRFTNGKLDKVK